MQSRWLQGAALVYIIICLFIVVSPDLPSSVLRGQAMGVELRKYFVAHPLQSLVAGLIAALCFSLLCRQRYLVIDKARGIAYYSTAFIGHRTFYLVEVSQVELEIDLARVISRLKIDKLYNISLRLRSGKSLLISQEWTEKAAYALCYRLQEVFQVEIRNLHRVDGKSVEEFCLGNYTIIKELSHGGMGKVFLAKEKLRSHQVAVKILPTSLCQNPFYLDSFLREAEILQRLSHPNIVKLLAVGKEQTSQGELHFYVMEYIRGKPLSKWISSGDLSVEQSVRFTLQIALALDHAHYRGILHRDIKPGNIMIREDGGAVLIDFGIAEDISWQTTPHKVDDEFIEVSHYRGTLPYMSREQLLSQETIDYRTDIYSLGVSCYEMLTGRRPFRGTHHSIVQGILNYYPSPPSKYSPEVSKELDTIVMKAMEKNKWKRYQTGAEMAEELHSSLHGLAIASRPPWLILKLYRKVRSVFYWFF